MRNCKEIGLYDSINGCKHRESFESSHDIQKFYAIKFTSVNKVNEQRGKMRIGFQVHGFLNAIFAQIVYELITNCVIELSPRKID